MRPVAIALDSTDRDVSIILESSLDNIGLEFGRQLSEESKPEMIKHDKCLALGLGGNARGAVFFILYLLNALTIHYSNHILLCVQNAYLNL